MAHKVLAILRASTLKQEIESQKMALGAYLVSKGFKMDEIRFEAYKGASAWKINKTYLNMVEEIKHILSTTNIKAVGLWHLNRLGRREEKLNDFKYWFRDNHIQVYLNNPSMELLDENGELKRDSSMVWSMFATMVEEDTKEMLDKIKRGKNYSKMQGYYGGGNCVPLGYTVKDKKIVVDEEGAKIVRKIFNLYAEGLGVDYIYEYLLSIDIDINKNSLHKLLRREKYKEIIPEELFNKVQDIKNSKVQGDKVKVKTYCLAGAAKIVCPECGRHYTNMKNFWQCIGHSSVYSKTDKFCNNSITISEKYIDWICRQLTSYYAAEDIIKDNDERRNQINEQLKEIPLQIETQKKILKGVQKRIERTAESYIDGLINKEKRDERNKKILKEKNKAETELIRLYTLKRDLEDELNSQPKIPEHLGLEGYLANGFEVKKKLFEQENKYLYPLVAKYIDHIEISKFRDYKWLKVFMYDGKIQEFAFKGHGVGFKFYSYLGTIYNPKEDRPVPMNPDDFSESDLLRLNHKDGIYDEIELEFTKILNQIQLQKESDYYNIKKQS